MTKKVTDILPPKKEKLIKVKTETPSSLKLFSAKKSFPRLKSLLHFKKVLVFALFLLILAGAFSYFTLSKVEIKIWPETQSLSLETNPTIDTEAKEKNVLTKVLPGYLLAREKTLTETFSSSGKSLKETKAEGMIRVYNEYSTSPQILIAATRFVSSDGKVFRTPSGLTVPGGTYEGGRFIPGEIDVKVVADEPGPEYNIGPSTFSIPGFAGTDRYTKFYAKSFQAMAGGAREEVFMVTREDIIKAEEALTKKGKEECEKVLNNELRSEEISLKFNYFPEEVQTEIIEKFSLVDPEEEAKEFKFQVKSKCEILLFGKDDLESFARELIGQQISQEENIYEESLKINYSFKSADLFLSKMTLNLEVQAKSYHKIDVYDLKNALVGRSKTEAEIFLENQPKTNKAEVKFWPFWVKKVPDDLNKIEIEIKVDS